MIHSPLALVATITGITALAFWLEGRFGWARQVGASLLAIALGAVVSNLALVPMASPVYAAITGPVTSLAIVWLLLAVDLRDLKAAGPVMLLAFGIAVVATSVGAFAATLLLHGALPDTGWQLAGVMTGTYSGGSLNFVAVGREVGLADDLFTAAAAADNVLTAVWMGATLLLPLWLVRFDPPTPRWSPPPAGYEARQTTLTGDLAASPFELLALLTLGLGLLLTADGVGRLLPAVPTVIWLTTLALAIGHLPPVRGLSGAFPLGLLALNLFFVVIGIGSRVAEIFRLGPEVFTFTLIVVATHGVLIYAIARLFGIDVATTAVASQAAVGGPSTALALATARGWRHLALPGVVVGLAGYAAGNYAGLAMAALTRALFFS